MKLKNLVTAGLSIAVVFSAVKYLTFSQQQNKVKELLPTKQCPECNFTKAHLKRLDLQGVNFPGANLERANLLEPKLTQANLKNANLKRANLTGADQGCAGITFNLEANEKEANMDFNVTAVPEQNNPENAVVGFNLKATDRGATMGFNLMGCPDFSNASLQEAKMPKGIIHPQ